MNIKYYVEQRQKLMDEARAALNSGDLALAREKREAIEALDAEKEKHDKETASLNALLAMKVSAPLNLEEQSVEPEGARTTEKTGGTRNEETLYRSAFARTLMNLPLSAEEKAICRISIPCLRISSNLLRMTTGLFAMDEGRAPLRILS